MSKSPIWLNDTDSEIALGFIGEILAEELSNIDRKVLSEIYAQLSGNLNGHDDSAVIKETDNHYAVEIDTTTKHRVYVYAPDKESAQIQALSSVVRSFSEELAPHGKVWSHQTEHNLTPNKIVSSIHEIQG